MQRLTNYLLRVVVVVVTFSLVVSPVSYAFDKQFFANNQLIIYDPDGNKCASGSTAASLTEEQKIGQILNVGFDSSSIAEVKSTAQKYQLGGVYLNIQDPSKFTPADISDINSGMKSQLIVATDDEGGQISRMLPKGAEPSAKQLGKMSNSQVLAAGKDTGTRLKKVGVNTVLGPVLDIDTGLKNAISPYDRSFSANPDTIATKASAWASGVTTEGVGVVFKHFPGIGSNVGNTDNTYVVMTSKPDISQYTKDLIPYNNSTIKGQTSAAVMLANFVLPGWGSDPVSVNPKAVTYLRDTVGFHGLVTTDDLSVMSKSGYGSHQLPIDQAVVKALNAKVDMPLFAYPGAAGMDSIVAAVKAGVSSSIVDTAYQNVTAYKTSLSLTTTAPTTPTGGTSTVVSGSDNRSKIWSFLISTKFSGYGNQAFGPVQAAGAIGNFFQESGWRFDAVQPNGDGHGIAQWSNTRRGTLMALASKMGKPWSSEEVQFQMITNELNGSYGKALVAKGYDKLTDPVAASLMFQLVYEGAGDPQQQNRNDAAKKALKDLAGIQPGAAFSSSAGGGCTPSDSSTSASTLTNAKASFTTKDGFPVYLQQDPRWANTAYGSSTIGPSGCGPTTMAMIISALTGQSITPDVTAKQAASDGMYTAGSGSSWDIANDLAKHYGLKTTSIGSNAAKITSAVKAGSYVVIAGKGALPFTSAGHYIAIRGVTSDGQWQVADPGHQATNDQTFAPATILSMAAGGSIYAVSK